MVHVHVAFESLKVNKKRGNNRMLVRRMLVAELFDAAI